METNTARAEYEAMEKQAVVSNPDVMNGTPCFDGTRVPFQNLKDYLEGGHPLGVFLRQFPTVSLSGR